ncbi:MAG TPA: flagellar filament capping protein FliD, partial [Clostridiales bacterium]|nr:flagellar filament capping protein FliD [Clostridiales bacterium]
MNIMRISGLASGMDTESIVESLMKVERMRLDGLNQTKQLALWKQEQYNEINKELANFIIQTRKELELTLTTSYGTTLSNSISNLNWVKKASSSNENVLTAKATSQAVQGTHKIQVEQLAEGVNIASKHAVKTTDGKQATLITRLSQLGVEEDGTITFAKKVNLNGVEQEINISVSYEKDTTIHELVQKINQAVGELGIQKNISLGIQASFDEMTGRLFLSTKDTGEYAQIKVVDDKQGLFTGAGNKFNLYESGETDEPLLTAQIDPETGEVRSDVKFKKGQDAIIHFDGAENLRYSSNTFLLNGIQIDLKSADPGKEYTIKVETDVDSVFDKIKSFVEKYNALVEKLNSKLSEKRYRDYLPLTDEQKKALKEDEIKKWEEKAKSGLLRNDEMIERIVQNMRLSLYEKVEGTSKYNLLSSIGITTGEWNEKGKLVIDESKLKQAILDDVDGVINLLFAPTDSENPEKTGLVNRVYDRMIEGMKEIIDKSGTGENKELYRSVQSNILVDFVTNMGSISYLDLDLIELEKRIIEEQTRLAQT